MKTCIDDFGSTFSNSNLGLLMNPELDDLSSDEIGPKNAITLSKPGLVWVLIWLFKIGVITSCLLSLQSFSSEIRSIFKFGKFHPLPLEKLHHNNKIN